MLLWSAVVFGGFRLSADLYLHFLNLQVYAFSKFKLQGNYKESWPTLTNAFAAFCIFTVLPISINIFYEANERTNFLHSQRIPQNKLGSFWKFVLKWGVTSSIAAPPQISAAQT